jgi:protein-ribulosamine 3-kinase
MFEAEAVGLAELARPGVIRVPRVYDVGENDTGAFLLMEWLDLGEATPAVSTALGNKLAALHRVTGERHGWIRENTIGLTPQHNRPSDDWAEFFGEHRLAYQLDLAASQGFTGELQSLGSEVLRGLHDILKNRDPEPSLLHGDLWSGNWSSCDGEPVIFDPAVYYGDRETDLAMTRLFGGFDHHFYEAYEASWALAAGHERRLPLYQLYHVINHVNLFGGGYVSQAIGLMRTVLRAEKV